MKIDKEYKKTLKKMKNFENLSKCRNMDFPNNLDNICRNNLSIFMSYYNKQIKNKTDYKIKFDYTLITFIYNFLASLKSYINRKKRYIDKNVPSEYKKEIETIVQKHWKSKRKLTLLDKLILIRDRMEHENLTSGIVLNVSYYKDYIEQILTIDGIDIVKSFNDSMVTLASLNEEINDYINKELSNINLRHCALFLNAFHKKYKKKEFTRLFPEATKHEIIKYENLIDKLSKEIDDW